ncbi:MAG: HAMP domain-containing protein [Coprococcus sp.]|nr:HAMP domain-containing protein [Coprococcus sp.]
MFKNLKMRSKLLLSFGIVIVFYIVTVVVSFAGLSSVSNGLASFYEVPYPMVEHTQELQSTTRQVYLDLYRALVAGNTSDRQATLASIEDAAKQKDASLAALKTCYEGDPSMLQAIETAAAKTGTLREEAAGYIKAGDTDNALATITGEYNSACNELDEILNQTIEAARATADDYYSTGMSTKKICQTILFILAIVCVILTILLIFRIVRVITIPLAEIQTAMIAMSKGDMHPDVSYQSNDELGDLAEKLRFVLSTLAGYIEHICSKMDSLATGDFSVDFDMDYLGEFESIKSSGSKILESLNDTLSQLHQAADQVASGSDQVSSGAQALSQGATEQASSVEELAATLNDLSTQVNQNAQNSRDINSLIELTAGEVDNSNRKMEQMMAAMTKINDCSSQIEKIIKTIEDIAFQTNILALNAAVEAARAGEAGKGFAVVADEVRSLASKSAEAAKDTTVLISNSLNAVSEGNQIAADTQSSLLKVVANAQKISDGMAKITDASDMQAEGISQITVGIDQISSVVQTNSATAEESAAASEELFSQSSLLKNLVGKFRLKGMPAVSSAPVSTTPIEELSVDLSSASSYTPSYSTSSYSSPNFVDDNAKY